MRGGGLAGNQYFGDEKVGEINKAVKIPYSDRMAGIISVLCIMIVLSLTVTTALLGERLYVVRDNNASMDLAVVTVKNDGQLATDQADEVSGSQKEQDAGTGSGGGKDPVFSVTDDNQTWTKEMDVEIFRAAYDEQGRITVLSENGDSLIAPGTGSAYTFQLKNSGNCALDYNMDVSMHASESNDAIPLEVKMSRSDGRFLAGDDNNWTELAALDGAKDAAVLGADSFTAYTLEWQWPFETMEGEISSEDLRDTLLGNMEIDEELNVAIKISVTASADEDPTRKGGTPKTGDDSQLTLFIVIAIAATVILLIILIFLIKERREKDE